MMAENGGSSSFLSSRDLHDAYALLLPLTKLFPVFKTNALAQI
jgi:hypothetical protein